MRWGRWTIGIAVALFSAADPAQAGTILHVDDDAAPLGDGLSWQTAFNDLTDALQAVNATVSEIWVAAGTYIPTVEVSNGSPGSVAFWLPNNLTILGGFIGNESDAGDRDPDLNPTILSGELGVPGDPTDNSWHVLQTTSLTDNTAVLDGFVIAHGYAYVSSVRGAGANLDDGDPVFIHCWFVDNDALDDGGAVWSDGSPTFIDCMFTDNHCGTQGSGGAAIFCSGSPTITGCTFQDNVSDRFAGAVFAVNGTVSDCIFDWNVCVGGGGALLGTGAFLNVTDCLFSNNHSTFNDGGAMFNAADAVTIVNCTFIGNTAPVRGGAIDNTAVNDSTTLVGCSFLGNSANEGGGVIDWSDTMRIINCSFQANTSVAFGGAIWSLNALETTVANCTIVANGAGLSGGGIYSPSTTTTVANTILWLNTDSGGPDETAQVHATGTLDINYSLVMGLTGGFGGTGNFDQDPMLLDAIGDDFTAGTADDDLRLIPGSPCIDVGSNDLVPADSLDLDDDLDTAEPIPFDGYGGTRFYDDPGTVDGGQGTAPIVDVGAHEFDETTQQKGPDPGEYVGPSGGSWFEPTHWAGGAVPDSGTNVLVKTTVEIDQPGAVANIVLVDSGGILVIGTGSLTTSQIVVVSGGLLMLDHPTAQIDVGTLTVQFGGLVQWNAGTVAVTVGWDDPNGIALGCSGDATLAIGPGATVNTPIVEVCAAGTLTGAGTVIAVVENDGVVAPGGSTGPLTIGGDFTQSVTGTLSIELGGYAAGAFDQLLVSGTATLAGTVDIGVVGSFAPELAGDQRIIRADKLNGVFATENVAVLPGTFVFELAYDVFDADGLPRTLQLLTTLTGTGPRLYVNAAAGPGGDGQSWLTATNDLAAALEFAPLFPGTVNNVWVAAATYKPGGGTDDRASSFVLVPGVAVYGGFTGDESDLGQRDYTANPTTLSGDFAGDDGPGFANNAENAVHVVTTTFDGTRDPVLDGFIITGGNADRGDVNDPDRLGGGLRNLADFSVIANCMFTGNAAIFGGAVNDSGSDSVFSNCTFIGNEAASQGGAIAGGSGLRIGCTFVSNSAGRGGAVWGTSSQTVYEDCLFQANVASRGGAIFGENNFNVTLVRCDFVSNDAQSRGAAVRLDDSGCRLQAVDCEFVVNTAEQGGAVSSAADEYSFDGCLFEANLAAEGGAVKAKAGVPAGTFTDCTFIGNESVVRGGALALNFGSTVLVNCSFHDQHAWAEGGAIRCENAALTLINCEFVGNDADDRGGAIAILSSGMVDVFGSTFQGNSAAVFGGAVAVQSVAVSFFTNCLFAGNSAFNGGALHSVVGDPELVNCTIVDNAAAAGGGLFSDATVPSLTNCILWGNVPESLILVAPLPVVTYSDVEGGFGGEGNIDALPGFADPDGPDDDPSTVGDNDYRLSAGSPCVDAGNNTVVPECGVVDLDGLSRFVDDPDTPDTGFGDPPIVDMGAWELGGGPSPDDCNGNGIADACDTALALEADCDGNGLPDVCEFIDCNGNGVTDQCDVADGISPDCNANGIPDECDVGDGTSPDCDGNGVPDECDADCNGNGFPDPCDIEQGLSEDFNGNGTPDECDCFDIGGAGGVTMTDILIMFDAWGPNPGHPADLDGDGVVGILDFLALLRNWGPC